MPKTLTPGRTSVQATGASTPTVSALLAATVRVARLGGWQLLLLSALSQFAMLVTALPLLQWASAQALRAAGVTAFDVWLRLPMVALPPRWMLPLSLVAALVALLLQLVTLTVAVQRVRAGEPLFARRTMADLWVGLAATLGPPRAGFRRVAARGVMRPLQTALRVLAAALVLFVGVLTLCGASVAVAAFALVVTDEFIPDASHQVAAAMLALVQCTGVLASGLFVAAIIAVLLVAADGVSPAVARSPAQRGRIGAGVLGGVVVAAMTLANMPVVETLARVPNTVIVAHRGDSSAAVENTIASLDAAHRVGADLVEIDVMQSADGGWVVVHDRNLKRLAGIDVRVQTLTVEQLTALRVHDGRGNAEPLPSLRDFVTRAGELGQRLLIEVKVHGGETDDYVERLVDELAGLGVLESHAYQSMDLDTAERLKAVRPDLTVGYTVTVAGGEPPRTEADFLAVEQWSLRPALHEAARTARLGLMAWTVNEDWKIRDLLHDEVDAIITDTPEAAVRARDEIQSNTGLLTGVLDAVGRLVSGR